MCDSSRPLRVEKKTSTIAMNHHYHRSINHREWNSTKIYWAIQQICSFKWECVYLIIRFSWLLIPENLYKFHQYTEKLCCGEFDSVRCRFFIFQTLLCCAYWPWAYLCYDIDSIVEWNLRISKSKRTQFNAFIECLHVYFESNVLGFSLLCEWFD